LVIVLPVERLISLTMPVPPVLEIVIVPELVRVPMLSRPRVMPEFSKMIVPELARVARS
jgi:hypothetical protein